jgi:SAM-dependent methyltransferase
MVEYQRTPRETSNLLHITEQYCIGTGVDFGCESDPHPAASILVDMNPEVHALYGNMEGVSVHIRDIDNGFPDWDSEFVDFAYSSHCIEHLRKPIDFLRECIRIVRPGGNIIIVGPHEDWYWPNGHPDANPDHSRLNWSLRPSKIVKWLEAAAKINEMPIQIEHVSEHGQPENWSFCVVAKRLHEQEEKQDKFAIVQDFYEICEIATVSAKLIHGE